jgi:hypothetical protein
VPTGEIARKRLAFGLSAMRSGVWYPVIEPPTAAPTPPDCVWVDVGQAACVRRSSVEIRRNQK